MEPILPVVDIKKTFLRSGCTPTNATISVWYFDHLSTVTLSYSLTIWYPNESVHDTFDYDTFDQAIEDLREVQKVLGKVIL